MKRILFVLTAAALLMAMVGASAVPAMAQVNLDNNDGVFDDNDNGIFDDDEDDEDGDEIDDVDVEEAFIDGDDVCVTVVTEYEDGSTDVDEECVDVEDA